MITQNIMTIDNQILGVKKELVGCIATRFDIYTLHSEFKVKKKVKELVGLYKLKFV